ncbi:FAD-dependent oxidoreductase [Rhizorhabdus argentea]|uniref:FAD-dependent oxidoreductase n=1 Tax=Rhizorhabdus argentea TaxID=1387174 RepID=UPI0030EEC6BC
MSEADVIVVGSGPAGLTAAIAAALAGSRVLVLEKTDLLGGTGAWSGGAAWVPCNPLMDADGVPDSFDAAQAYIRAVAGNLPDERMIATFLEQGPKVVAHLETRTTAVRFSSYGGSDYHPELAGATPRARSLLPLPYDGRELGSFLKLMRGPMPELTVFGGMQVDAAEAVDLQYSWKRWRSFKVATRLMARYAIDLLRYRRGTRMIRGQALIARLLRSAIDLGVEFQTSSKVEELLYVKGRVVGVRARRSSSLVDVKVVRGVVLATGGFSANPALVERHFPFPDKHLRVMPSANMGEGLQMAQAVGATMDQENADNGIWMPASSHRFPSGKIARYPHFAFDRCKPGALIVDKSGERFVNEAAPYHVLVRAMHARGAVPAWLIGDKRFLRKYGMGIARPFPYPYRKFVRQGYLIEGATLTELAAKLSINHQGLLDTVARMNRFAMSGVDEDFGKGGDMFTRALGDQEHGLNPCLGSIDRSGPFFALALYPSDCGSTLGLRTNENAQVLGRSGQPIEGLYACGLDMNSVLRGNYPGAGTMIGPAITFGYLAGSHAASLWESPQSADERA